MEIKLLPCPVCCNPHFGDVDALRTTLVRVATNLVSCPVCAETLLGLDKLTIHLFSHISNHTQSRPDIEEVLQQEIDTKIETEANNVPEEPVHCDICNFSFTDQHILDIHQKLLHQTPPDVKTGTYSYHCHLCSKKFKMRGSLMVHLRVAHYGFIRKESAEQIEQHTKKKEENANGEEFIEAVSEKSAQKFQDNKQWECDVCSKLFTTKYFLKKHKRLHTGEMPYCCTLCNKSFTFQQSYHKHMLYHSSEKPHVCSECGRAFKELSTLQNHARIHSGERPFICETCGKSFRQRVSYLVHRRIHTGVMPYKCPTCDKSFRYKVSQKSHKCLMHSPAVVDATDQQISSTSQSSPKCVMNVDLDTGNISVVIQEPKEHQMETVVSSESPVQKKSILLNDNNRIEISYNTADLESNIIENKGRPVQKTGDTQDEFEKLMYTVPEKALFSPTMALLPEVESLYLNSSPTNNLQMQEMPDREESINDMREKCLEELLKAIE
ncbi:zinc finger protein ZFP2 isoform X1 [Diabrotica virgifera virgifera]|uniref:C2H2-type domain-containing protein n=1 Tax=Diabrotica virgifera virgifera TaxID=50390 RepID=A0ABM5KSZ5_DIAVI|nr:zinc finger protein ZFP2 isoform X1 [Diabrotica virgifera virgifera]